MLLDCCKVGFGGLMSRIIALPMLLQVDVVCCRWTVGALCCAGCL